MEEEEVIISQILDQEGQQFLVEWEDESFEPEWILKEYLLDCEGGEEALTVWQNKKQRQKNSLPKAPEPLKFSSRLRLKKQAIADAKLAATVQATSSTFLNDLLTLFRSKAPTTNLGALWGDPRFHTIPHPFNTITQNYNISKFIQMYYNTSLSHLYKLVYKFPSILTSPQTVGYHNLFVDTLRQLSTEFYRANKPPKDEAWAPKSLFVPDGRPLLNRDVSQLIFQFIETPGLFKLMRVSKPFKSFAWKALKNREHICRICDTLFVPSNKEQCKGHLSPLILSWEETYSFLSCCEDPKVVYCHDSRHIFQPDRVWSLTPIDGYKYLELDLDSNAYFQMSNPGRVSFTGEMGYNHSVSKMDVRMLAGLMKAEKFEFNVSDEFNMAFVLKSEKSRLRLLQNVCPHGTGIGSRAYFYFKDLPVSLPRFPHSQTALARKRQDIQENDLFDLFG